MAGDVCRKRPRAASLHPHQRGEIRHQRRELRPPHPVGHQHSGAEDAAPDGVLFDTRPATNVLEVVSLTVLGEDGWT